MRRLAEVASIQDTIEFWQSVIHQPGVIRASTHQCWSREEKSDLRHVEVHHWISEVQLLESLYNLMHAEVGALLVSFHTEATGQYLRSRSTLCSN